jgi:hypothetical protein
LLARPDPARPDNMPRYTPGRAHERGSLVFISTPGTVVDRAWIFARSFTRATGSKFSVSKVYICYTPSYRGCTRDALTRNSYKYHNILISVVLAAFLRIAATSMCAPSSSWPLVPVLIRTTRCQLINSPFLAGFQNEQVLVCSNT